MNAIKSRISRIIACRKYRKDHITIGKHADVKNARLGSYVNIAHHAQVGDAAIGKRTSIGRYTKVRYAEVGKYCSISWDVTIGAIEHPIHALSTHAFPYRKRFGLCDRDEQIDHKTVTVGNDVWIGCGAIIMPGTVVGDGAIIGAGAVVTHDVSAYEIVGGVPAKHISWRFPAEMIQQLEKIKWWNASDQFVREHIDLFSPTNDLTAQDEIIQTLLLEMNDREEE